MSNETDDKPHTFVDFGDPRAHNCECDSLQIRVEFKRDGGAIVSFRDPCRAVLANKRAVDLRNPVSVSFDWSGRRYSVDLYAEKSSYSFEQYRGGSEPEEYDGED